MVFLCVRCDELRKSNEAAEVMMSSGRSEDSQSLLFPLGGGVAAEPEPPSRPGNPLLRRSD